MKTSIKRLWLIPLLIIGMFVFAACAGATESVSVDSEPATVAEDTVEADEAMSEETADEEPVSDDSMSEGDAHDDAAAEDAAEAEEAGDTNTDVERPSWQQIALTDARSGETFTLADYAGQTVYVEPFATWCGNCRRQLGNVQSAHAELGEEAVFLALSVEPNIAAAALVDYADNQGFEFGFAAMPPEMLQQLAAEFGQTIGNPPATPHFIIRPDGSTTEMTTGFKEPEAIIEQIRAASS